MQNKKLIIISAVIPALFLLNSCDNLGDILSSPSKIIKSGTDEQVVRGPTGGGSGGGILTVENNSGLAKNTRYIVYLEEDGNKTEIKSGTTYSSAKVYLSEDELSPEQIEKIASGEIEISVEIYQDGSRTAAKSRFQSS